MGKRVLFVMEDPSELSSMKTMLAPLSGELELPFVAKAEEALAVLDQSPIDVILSGIHLTGMGGLELLAEVKRRAPMWLGSPLPAVRIASRSCRRWKWRTSLFRRPLPQKY